MKKFARVEVALLVAAAAAASLTCTDDPAAPELRPAALVQVSGDDQQGTVGHPLPDSLVVRVDDAQGRPVGGVSVFWTTSGGGQVHPTMTVTSADGQAAVQRTMGDTAGEHRTTATVPDLPPVVFTAVAETGTEVPHLVLTTQPSAAAESGVAFEQQPMLRALDALGDPLPAGLAVTATVAGATLTGTATVESNASGDVAFTDLGMTGPDGNYTITFSAPSLTPVQSRQIALSATTGGKLTIVTQPSATAENAVPLARQPVIRVVDGAGNPLGAGIAVTVAATGGASLIGTKQVQSDASGEAHFTDLALSGGSGNYTLSFTSPDLASVQSTAIALTSTTSDGGSWTAPFDWPVVGVHMVLLPDGKVLTLGRVGQPYVWDPATGTFTASPSPAWLFCSGHNLLPDGRVLFAGGHISDHHGLPNITMYGSSGWSSSAPMARGRWYPSTTVMGNGEVVILAGEDEQAVTVDVPEVWSNGTVRQLTSAAQVYPFYPRAFVAPDGRLYYAGAVGQTKYLSTAGNGTWSAGPPRLYPGRNYGSAVMYDDGKIIYAGGGYTTNTAEVVDLNEAAPAWHWTSPMAFARRHLNLTVLPTGEVLATGGVAGTAFNDISTGVHAAEIWNPTTGQWTTLASSAITRGYHATSLLLPDGRVLHGGSGDGAGAPNQRNAEIYSPPYLFRGARPTINGGPTDLTYGSTFRLDTPDAASITHVSLIRLGAVTHAFDQGQRFQRLAFTADASGLQVTAPASGNRAPPGYYMVFILNGADVPSVGKIVRVH